MAGRVEPGRTELPLVTGERLGEESEPEATMGALPLHFTVSV
jgi:hypothetical protein